MATLQVLETTPYTKWPPRALGCFPANHPTKPQQHHLQTKAACTHPRDTPKVLDSPAVGKGFASCPLAYECQNNLKFPCQFTNFSLQMNAHYKMKEQGPLNTFNDHCPINIYKISTLLQKCDGLTVSTLG